MKAQSSFETLVTVATFLLFTIPIVLLVLSSSSLRLEDLSISHARTSAQQLSDTINTVYLEGNQSKRSILIELPANAENLTILGSAKSVIIYLNTESGPYEISHSVFANVSDFSISRSGLTPLTIEMNNSQVVVSG